MVFQHIVANVAIDFSSYIENFENKAFGLAAEIPIIISWVFATDRFLFFLSPETVMQIYVCD